MATLYLMMGYPGSGKTTTAQMIHDLNGAVHLWADKIRRERFGDPPTYSSDETKQLYAHLNQVAEELLSTGQSVIYDTNFNFYSDRQSLREMGTKHDAEVVLIWVKVPREVAQGRATAHPEPGVTRVLGNMSETDFTRLANHLQEPQPDELPVIIDGTRVTLEYVNEQLAHRRHEQN